MTERDTPFRGGLATLIFPMPLDLIIVFIHGNSLERLAAGKSCYLPLLGRLFVTLSLPLVVCIDSRPLAWTQVADNPLGSGNLGSSIS